MASEMDSTPTAPIPDSSARLRRAKEIYLQVNDMGLARREEVIDRLCVGDEALRREVLGLLRGENLPLSVERLAERLRAAQEAMTGGPSRGGTSGMGERMEGSTIGRYRLLERLGEGGFGVVFMAEQTEPVRRVVALKILKLGMDTGPIVARFEAERQALALMDHPNIARVLDAGATDSGRPYFVMELVKGEPITAFCDRARMPIKERLELFATVCEAIQHAHTKGVIHRDIKPSNILVSFVDGRPVPKVIDFGIAKAIDRPLTEKAVFTELRQLIGTPEYMSPEQAEGSRDIDTRTDVYSLGVVLYELLTGGTPFESTKLRSAAYGEIQRIIREEEPPKPSTKLSASLQTKAGIATNRRTEADALAVLIKRELDWIVMKALDKDRSRRYESPSRLMADVKRFIKGDAVEAVPPSVVYRVRKFVRRHRVGVVAGGLVAASLVIGLAAALWQRGVAVEQRAAALEQKQAAESRSEELRQVVDFIDQTLGKSFGVFDTEVSKLGGSLRAREALAMAMKEQAEKAPEVAAGTVPLRKFKASTLERLGDLRGGTRSASKGDLEGALEAYASAKTIREKLLEEQPEDPDRLTELAMVHRRLADVRTKMEQPEAAAKEIGTQRSLLEKAAGKGEKGRPAKRLIAAMELQDARRHLEAGRFEDAEKGYAKAGAMYEELLKAQPSDKTARRDSETYHLHLGDLAMARDDHDTGKAEYEKTVEIARALLAEEASERHERDVSVALYSLGTALRAKGDTAGAKARVDEAVAMVKAMQARAAAEKPASDARLERDLKLFLGLQSELEKGAKGQ
jgi:serine/threonine protein kinase/tetratricopeptide (TPR) repeat protein